MHVRYLLLCGALMSWTRPPYELPDMPILPLLHSWAPTHSWVSKPSGPSWWNG